MTSTPEPHNTPTSVDAANDSIGDTTSSGSDTRTGSDTTLAIAAATRIGNALRHHNVTIDGLTTHFGNTAMAALHRENPLPLKLATQKTNTPTATLTQFFLLAQPTTTSQLTAALHPHATVEDLITANIAKPTDNNPGEPDTNNTLQATITIAPHQETWYVASDHPEYITGTELAPDHVLGVGGATAALANFTLRTPANHTLDLGTGSGTQTLHATTYSTHITATDISTRALHLTQLTLALSNITTPITTHHGNLFEPVHGQRFDRIISNPPFVITPKTNHLPTFEYRDAGLAGDQIIQKIIQTLPDTLTHPTPTTPGGTAQFLANWEIHNNQPWDTRIREWLDPLPLDYWIIQRETHDPAQYAEMWLRDAGSTHTTNYTNAFTDWINDFASRNVTQIGFGYVLAIHNPNPTLRRTERTTGPTSEALGAHMAACVESLQWWTQASTADQLGSAWQVAEDVTEERFFTPGESDPSVICVRQTAGFGRQVQVSSVAAGAIGACDGELTLGQICGALAHLTDADVSQVAAQLLGEWSELAAGGFVARITGAAAAV